MDDELFGTVLTALNKSWSTDTCPENIFSKEDPSYGQCGQTAVVIFDRYGGEILKTNIPGINIFHIYNRIDGIRRDFTKDQFDNPFDYEDKLITREIAIVNHNYKEQYINVLRMALEKNLENLKSNHEL